MDVDPCASWPVTLEEDADGFYEIGSADALYKFACMVNNGATDINGRLTADICVNACGEGESVLDADGALNGSGGNFNPWTPMGSSSQNFLGTFDGNGHTISGLYFNNSKTDYVGLFGYIGNGAKVHNLGVIDSYSEGKYYVGGVVGYSAGTITNSYNMGSVSGVFYVGGLVGYNTGVVMNCFNTGLVRVHSSFAGGVVGHSSGTISNVYSVGSVNGDNLPAGQAIVGGRRKIGSVLGINDGGTISSAYYNEDAACINCVSPIEGIGKIAAEFADGTVAQDLHDYYENGVDGSVWGQDLTKENSLPDFSGEIKGTLHGLTLNTFEGDDRKYPKKYVQEKGLELPTDLVRENYVFVGWYENEQFTGAQVSAIPANSSGAVEYWAKWGPKSAITLNLNGGDELAPGEGVTFYGEGKRTALPSPTRENYVFVGWYTNEDLTGSSVSEIPSTSTGAVEYWAKWGGKITLHLNGGDELPSGEGVTFYYEGKGAVLPTPMREGCLFFGWYTNKDLTGPSVSAIPSTSRGAVEYWAKWGYAITLNLNGGDELAPGEGVTFYYEGKGAVLPTPMRKDYAFVGWYTNKDLTGSSVSAIPSTSRGAVEYWAKWGPKSEITLNLNGGDELAPGEGVTFYYEGKGAALPTPMREDYAFLGWSTKQNAESVADMVTSIAKGSTGAKEFYAQWIKVNADGCYEIASVDSLYKFAFAVNVMSNGEICGVLAENIVVNTGVLKTDGTLNTVGGDFKSWTPMNVQNGVQVTLNGAGHVIGGLYFNDGNKSNVGLFGNVEGVVSIDSLGIVDSYFKGDYYVGGLVGAGFNLTITNSYNAGAVSGSDSEVGGLVGYIYDGTLTITNSYNAGTVSGSDHYVGGLVGYGEGTLTITNSYNAGTVSGDGDVGGLVGFGQGTLTITNSYNAGTVSGRSDVGGLVGYVYDGTFTITNSYNAGTVSGYDYVGGLVGEKYGKLTITNSYNAGTVSGDGNDVGGLVGYGDYGTLTITNSFFLATGKSGDALGGKAKTLDYFHNGAVAKELHDWCEKDGDNCKEGGLNGSVWGQDLRNANSLPDLSGVIGHKYGSVVFFYGEGNKIDSAYVDAASDLAVDFPNDVVVAGPVKFKRTFAGSGYSTIMLPFKPNCEDGDCIKNGANVKFYEFASYKNATVGVTEVSPSALQVNTPYLVQVTGASEIVFKNGGTFNTTTGGVYNSETGDYKKVLDDGEGNVNGWTIYGTYAYKTWEEGDAGLGKTYGFAGAADNDPAIVGQFAKIGVGAYIYPMRAYLEYTAPVVLARPAANGAARAGAANTVASLPETINVVIVEKGETGTEIAGSDDASGEQTTRVIGTINTRTGEFKFANDRWFDLQGRYLGVKKPTQKGAYYNNGKKVIVK